MALRTRGRVLVASAKKALPPNNINTGVRQYAVSPSIAASSPPVTPASSRHYGSCPCIKCYSFGALRYTNEHLNTLPQRRSFCAQSSELSGGEKHPLDVHVTHTDGSQAAAGEGNGAAPGAVEETEAQKALREAHEASQATGKPVELRFLDVPGSEETRAEKMTIVFTCTMMPSVVSAVWHAIVGYVGEASVKHLHGLPQAVCETRTAKSFSKQSYDKGVVLARCPGCHNLHLIADRLGWFEDKKDGGWDLTKLQERIGEADCHMVTNDNILELTLVDIMGKNTKQKGQDDIAKDEQSSGGSSATGDRTPE